MIDKPPYNSESIAISISLKTIWVNALLSAFKLFAGVFAHSSAIIADGIESLFDVVSSLIAIIGLRISGKESDAQHQYGHERFESVATLILAVILCVTGTLLGYSGLDNIISGSYLDVQIPGLLSLIAAVVSLCAKESLFWYTRFYGKKLDSQVLMASAWNYRSDSISSVGSFLGILFARLGAPILDPIASILISLLIVKTGIDIFISAIRKMTDEALDPHTAAEIKSLALSQPGVLGIDSLQTRLFGSRVYVDLEICADGNLTLTKAHDISEQVHNMIELNFPKVKHCMVHVNPFYPEYDAHCNVYDESSDNNDDNQNDNSQTDI